MGIKANYRIKPVSKTEFLKNLGASKDDFLKPETKGGVFDIIQAFGISFANDLAKKLQELNDIDTGNLIDSFNFKIKRFGQNYSFTFNLNDYYKYLDQGRKPGGKFPWDKTKGNDETGDGNVLYQWVKRNNYLMFNKNVTQSIKTKKTTVRGGKVQNQLTLAYLIGRKMQKYGTEGNHFFSKATKDGRIDKLTKDLSIALKTDVVIDIKEFVKEITGK